MDCISDAAPLGGKAQALNSGKFKVAVSRRGLPDTLEPPGKVTGDVPWYSKPFGLSVSFASEEGPLGRQALAMDSRSSESDRFGASRGSLGLRELEMRANEERMVPPRGGFSLLYRSEF